MAFGRPLRAGDEPGAYACQPDAALGPASPGTRPLRTARPRLQLTSGPEVLMSDWDSIFGEAALGLDLAKVDPARAGSRQALAATSSAPAPAVPGTRPAEPARSSLKLASRPNAPTASREAIFRKEALEFRVRGRSAPGGIVRLGARWIHWTYRILAVF